ncbi:concanavalin A-like lectin/glucanase domain-containing protein [Pilobolus umbonatus]|nr:concanavalin A-like lectin/glucanase domain-containing protein [Pilobolus umbonatus]
MIFVSQAVILLLSLALSSVNGYGNDTFSSRLDSTQLAANLDIERCLVFEDHFNKFNFKNWQHEITLSGGGNWEFEWYTNNRSNSFVQDGVLYLKPTLTSETIGESAVRSGGRMNLFSGSPSEACTDNSNYGCERMSGPIADGNIINPIQSARLRTINSVSLRYGKVEVRARLPKGDWLWPAIWMLPKYSAYGGWPASGEIDIMEARGNEVYPHGNISSVLSTLHWGPHYSFNRYYMTTGELRARSPDDGFAEKFHTFGLEWTKDGLRTYVDDQTVLSVDFNMPFWDRGQFPKSTMNPWRGGEISAPFDEEFYLILNLAVGGSNGYWPDSPQKPWRNSDPHAANAFYDSKDSWLPTWGAGNKRALAIDWVKMWSSDTSECI